MANSRKLIVHCGLHKTGSTALQRQLSLLADDLERDGLYLPSTFSKTRGAHHAMAHYLRRPRAFRRHQNQFAAFVEELQDAKADQFCVSSEDFETMLGNRLALGCLGDIASQADLQPVLVVYLRNQAEYFESLYLQMLRMGMDLTVEECLDQIIETGQLAWRKWIFQFDYNAFASIVDEAGFELVLRDYHDLKGGSSTRDFLSLLNKDAFVSETEADKRVNAARKDQNLLHFSRNILGGDRYDPSVVGEMDKLVVDRRPSLSTAMRTRLAERLSTGNEALRERSGIDLNAIFDATSTEKASPLIDRVFTTETLNAVVELSHAAAGLPQEVADRLRENWFCSD